METTQPRYLSKTIWAGIVGGIFSILGFLNVASLDDGLKGQIVDLIMLGITFGSAVMTIIYRIKATKTIAPILPTNPTI